MTSPRGSSASLTSSTDTSEHHRHPRRPPRHAGNHRAWGRYRSGIRGGRVEGVRRAQGNQPEGPDGFRAQCHSGGRREDVQEVVSAFPPRYKVAELTIVQEPCCTDVQRVARRRRGQRRVLVISYIAERAPIYPSESSYFRPNTAVRRALIFTILTILRLVRKHQKSSQDIVKLPASVHTRRSSATATLKTDLHAQHHSPERGIPKEPNNNLPNRPQTLPKPSA